MTREEAIKWFRENPFYHKDHEPFNMAIQALSQEPCDDVVSRKAVCDILNDIRDCISVEGYWAILERLKKLPSVTQKSGKWIDDEFGSKCSCCGIHTHLDKFDRPMKFKYCSMCGAKMESEDKG